MLYRPNMINNCIMDFNGNWLGWIILFTQAEKKTQQ